MKDVSSTLTVNYVPKAIVDMVWEDVVRLLEKSVDTANGKFTMTDIYNGLMNDMYLLWLVLDDGQPIAALTTRIMAYPNRRAMALDWIGGSRMREWLPTAQQVMGKYAKENHCDHLEGYGRKGWDRWLAKYGWKPEYIAYKMEL